MPYDIEVPLKGIATHISDLGYRNIFWHYSSDPVKDDEWIARSTQGVIGGAASDEWQQEQEINHHVVQGRLAFFAFSKRRNVISELPVELEEFRTWKHFLSADYGGGAAPTCWLFWAESPATEELVVYDSVYVHTEGRHAWPEEKRTAAPIAQVVYEKLRLHFGVAPSLPFNITEHVQYAIGDPAGKGFALEYSTCAYPIHIGKPTLPDSMPAINNIEAGEARVNSYLAPAFLCCADERGKRNPVFAEWAECPICGEKRRGRPRLSILKHNCKELIAQLQSIRKRVPQRPELEQDTKNVKTPDHATDALRYGAMTRSPEAVKALQEDVEKLALTGLDKQFHRHRTKLFERLRKEQELHDMGQELHEPTDLAMLAHEEEAEWNTPY